MKAIFMASLLTASCGSSDLRAKSVTPNHTTPIASVAEVSPLPAPQMELLETELIEELSTSFDVSAELRTVAVTLRLGPKMDSHTFEIPLSGEVDAAVLKEIRRLFRCRRSRRTHRIHTGLLAKLADLADHYDGRTIEIVSAYRHGPHAKPKSRHRHGRAIDIRVIGIPAAKVRDYLWARHDQEVGVGFYKQQQFIHLDHRTDYPATAWTQKHRTDDNEYHPRWSRASRREKLVVALSDQPLAL